MCRIAAKSARKARVGAGQTITFITCILSLVALFIVPRIVLFWIDDRRIKGRYSAASGICCQQGCRAEKLRDRRTPPLILRGRGLAKSGSSPRYGFNDEWRFCRISVDREPTEMLCAPYRWSQLSGVDLHRDSKAASTSAGMNLDVRAPRASSHSKG